MSEEKIVKKKRILTEEQKERLRAQLAKGRETSKRNREAKKKAKVEPKEEVKEVEKEEKEEVKEVEKEEKEEVLTKTQKNKLDRARKEREVAKHKKHLAKQEKLKLEIQQEAEDEVTQELHDEMKAEIEKELENYEPPLSPINESEEIEEQTNEPIDDRIQENMKIFNVPISEPIHIEPKKIKKYMKNRYGKLVEIYI